MSFSQVPVSIGIPFYNAEDTLLDAIRSIFAQTHQNWELILVDDGSTDNSLALARSIKDPRVRVYSDGKNRKLAARLNQITKLAKYDFIARMDADDLVSPLRLEKQIKLLMSKPDIDLIATGLCSLSDDNKPVGVRCVKKGHMITPDNLLSSKSGILHASLLARRQWFERNPYNEKMKLAEDYELWIRSYSNNDLKIGFISEPLYYYREDGSVSRNKLMKAYFFNQKAIFNSAKDGFLNKIKIKYIINYLFKSAFIFFFSGVGALKIARNRRNSLDVDKLDFVFFENEILKIRNIELPFSIN